MHVDWIWANEGTESKWWRKCINSKCEIGMKWKLTWGVELKLSVKVTWIDPHNGSLFKGMITAWEFHVKKPKPIQWCKIRLSDFSEYDLENYLTEFNVRKNMTIRPCANDSIKRENSSVNLTRSRNGIVWRWCGVTFIVVICNFECWS